jgi:cobalt/nickel transport system permease protein
MWYSPVELHIPDGFLTPLVAAIGWFLAIAMIVIAIRQTSRQLGERQIPMMGILAAFIFAAQAINFPVAAGTSGHLIGAALAAIVMGPWAGTLIMTAVVVVQALLFQDGGLLVMGWNIMNMGVIAAFSGYFTYSLVQRYGGNSRISTIAAAFAAGWISVVLSAVATALQLAASGTSPLVLSTTAMASVHAVIGIGEGIITAAAVGLLLATRPDLLKAGEAAPGQRTATFVLIGLAIALVVAVLSPLASSSPDGLEYVAEQQGFLELGQDAPYELLPDYTIPFITNPAVTTILAVVIGALLVFGGAILIGRLATRKEATPG